MMSGNIALGSVLLGLMLLLPFPARSDSASSPGKSAVAMSQTGVNLGVVPTTLSVQIAKGKKKRLLVVTGTAHAENFSGELFSDVTANGILMEPTNGIDNVLKTACADACTLTGTWWLDLDTAELANPGALVNVPINVAFSARADDINGGLFKLSATATLLKK